MERKTIEDINYDDLKKNLGDFKNGQGKTPLELVRAHERQFGETCIKRKRSVEETMEERIEREYGSSLNTLSSYLDVLWTVGMSHDVEYFTGIYARFESKYPDFFNNPNDCLKMLKILEDVGRKEIFRDVYERFEKAVSHAKEGGLEVGELEKSAKELSKRMRVNGKTFNLSEKQIRGKENIRAKEYKALYAQKKKEKRSSMRKGD